MPFLMIIFLAILAAILFAVFALFVYKPSPAKGFAFNSSGRALQLSDGRTLAYLDIGDPEGRPVFYFHGGPGSRLEGLLYDELSRQLGIRMIAPDRPGFGLSDFQENRTYLDWPKDVRELADHLGIHRFAVLGWSSGGPHAAAVAHEIPERLTVAAIAAGEGPYDSDGFPPGVLSRASFRDSRVNKLFIWSAKHGPWLMRIFFTLARIRILRNPAGSSEASIGSEMSAKDKQLFTRREFIASLVEALHQGAEGWTREYTIERLEWPFKLEDIHAPTVLVFHGEQDSGMPPGIAEYVGERIPACDGAKIYPGEGHSVVYYRYEEIIQAMLAVWK